MKKLILITLWFLLSLLFAACAKQPSTTLILATTTSTQDSGLLDVLVPAFESRSGYTVKTVAVGTGAALKLGAEGNADVLLVHAPSAEQEWMAQGFGAERNLVMHNDFVLVGPADDPARVRGQSIQGALDAIFQSGSPFISRGDDSGTNKKELAIWQSISRVPQGLSWYVESGQGMGATLNIASEKSAYTLTDRATYLANQQNLQLDILVEGDAVLLNIYHVITVNPQKWPDVNQAGAQAFADFVTSPAGQKIIAEFGVDTFGQPLFVPDAGKSADQLSTP